MKKKNIVSCISAFLSVAAIFIPMAEDREFGDYDHMVGGILYVFKRAGSGFYSSEPIWKIFAVLQVVAICMLLIWGISSLSKPESIGKKGITASIVNLVTTGLVIIAVIEKNDSLYVGLGVVAAITVFSLVMSIIQKRNNK